MKICDVCGTKNFKKSNYCFHCGNRITKDNYCPNCGKLNNDTFNFCKFCSTQLKPVAINNVDDLFTNYNISLLAEYNLSQEKYSKILDSIFERANYSPIRGDTIKEKILNFCQIFSKCVPKSKEGDYGNNFGDIINYEDRLSDSIQISTLIHELTHCILYNIFADLLCDIFQVKRSTTVESLAIFVLHSYTSLLVVNEYCASTVEGRFVPYGYQNYGSFLKIVQENDFSDEYLEKLVIFANTLAYEISGILEKYINEDLRNDIKFRFKLDDVTKDYSSINNETVYKLNNDEKLFVLMTLLSSAFEDAFSDKGREDLESIKLLLEQDVI